MLVGLIAHDNSLRQEHNINFSKDSGLQNLDTIKIKNGVLLTQYAPIKDGTMITQEEEE